MASRPAFKTEQFDMDSLFDFSQGGTQSSPVTASSSRMNDDWNSFSTYGSHDDRRQFNGPSHDYHEHKQQVGLPVGSTVNMPQHAMFDGYAGDMGFDSNIPGWSSGIDMDADMAMDFNQPIMSLPSVDTADAYINPNSIQDESSVSNVGRLWPGMHSLQAQQLAMQKAANTQAMQQRQMKLQAQHAQYRQLKTPTQNQALSSSQQGQDNGKRAASTSEPRHVEESISRLLSQMRQNSAAGDADDDSGDNMYPSAARMKKDEEEMDEDERLLASDEGKKLSSKERRQLRNKVSARAFRSRRKEYIGQLEGEVAIKVQEANDLRSENTALMQENDRYRGLIETLLRHPAFTPFINDISKDPSVLGPSPARQQMPPQQTASALAPSQQHARPQSQQQHLQQQQQQPPQQLLPDVKPDFLNFDAAQIQMPQQDDQQINLATIPEYDFSKLNLRGMQSAMDFNNFQSVNAFAVTDFPCGPDPANLLFDPPACSSPSPAVSAPSDALPSDLQLLLAKLDGAARKLDHGNL